MDNKKNVIHMDINEWQTVAGGGRSVVEAAHTPPPAALNVGCPGSPTMTKRAMHGGRAHAKQLLVY